VVRGGLTGPGAEEAARDLARQLDALVFPGWLRLTPGDRLRAFPRYLRAVGTRLDKIRQRDGKVAEKTGVLRPFMDRLGRWQAAGRSLAAAEIADYRWMVEEFRVSLFDQRLGTAVKVSAERLERQWERAVRGMTLPEA
jgi:ATP-dependent helicase HrpA